MAGETVITVVGNLTDDPELRFTPSGAAVANFTVASTPRTFDRQTNEWKDGESLFLSCNVWRQAAENVAESLQRGMRVILQELHGLCGDAVELAREQRGRRIKMLLLALHVRGRYPRRPAVLHGRQRPQQYHKSAADREKRTRAERCSHSTAF